MFSTSYHMNYSSKYTNSCYLLFVWHNFKLKTEVAIDSKSLLVTELNKFGVTGLLRFQKGISPSHVAKFPFQVLQYVQRNVSFLYKRKRHIDTKSDDNAYCCFCTKSQYCFIINYTGVWERLKVESGEVIEIS